MTDGPMTNSPERAWQLGREAGLDEVAEGTNPYDAGGELAADWADGWREGTKQRINCLVDNDQDWEAWTPAAQSGAPSPNHADAH
jgi:ribosome modulation factor